MKKKHIEVLKIEKMWWIRSVFSCCIIHVMNKISLFLLHYTCVCLLFPLLQESLKLSPALLQVREESWVPTVEDKRQRRWRWLHTGGEQWYEDVSHAILAVFGDQSNVVQGGQRRKTGPTGFRRAITECRYYRGVLERARGREGCMDMIKESLY